MNNKTDTSTIKQTAKRSLKPKLRFPEFQNAPEWEEVTLSNITKLQNGFAFKSIYFGSGEKTVLRIGDIKPAIFLDQGDFIKTTENAPQQFVASSNEYIIALSGATFGKVGRIVGNSSAYINQRTALFKPKENAGFIYQVINSNTFQNYLRKIPTTSAQPNISTSDILKYKLPIPCVKEQQKIADCLSSIDELINAQTQKLETLKAHKKGLMQKLFPAEGETLPKLRFPEFQNAPEWEEKKLGKICDILNSRRQPISSGDRKQGSYPYYGASGIIDFINDYIFNERLLLVGEDGAKWGAFEKTAFIVEGKYWVNNHAHVLKTTQVSDMLLENYLTMLDISPFITGTAPPKLTLGKLKEIPIPIPISIIEQQKIADSLSSVDDLITAQTQKLETLKAHKKGLMQQLFPAFDEVGK